MQHDPDPQTPDDETSTAVEAPASPDAAAPADAPAAAEGSALTDAPAPTAAEAHAPTTAEAHAPKAAEAHTPPDADGFASLGLGPGLVASLTELGYEEPTPIQRAAIPEIIAGRDVLAQAPTGTGKTAAFALPALERLATLRGSGRRTADGQVSMIVLVPTRELAMQVSEAIHRYGARLGFRALPVYGGQAIGLQLRALRSGVDVVIATPGRAVDHLRRGSLRLDQVAIVVLDEADEMLDMGFAEDLDAVLGETPEDRQTALFSATISPVVARIAKRHLREPVRLSVGSGSRTDRPDATIRQVAYVVRRADKLAALSRILDLEDPTSALVFARTRGEVDDLAERLAGRGHDAGALHGGLSQEQRDRVMGRFRDGALDVLVATDVAARGLDIDHVSHVVNYDVPTDPDSYVHRIGRTGRAGRSGVAITIVEPREHRLLRDIERVVGQRLDLGRVPTVADLRAHRMDLLRATVREQLLDGDTDRYRSIVESLAEEADLLDIALAAVALADGTTRDADDERDIAPATLFDERPARGRGVPGRPGGFEGAGGRGRPMGRPERGYRPAPGGGRPSGPGEGFVPGGGPAPSGGPGSRSPGRAASRTGGPGAAGWARLWVGGGRRAGLRPGDIVGAITHEAGVTGSDVGAIQIADAFALVDVRAEVADRVVEALGGATIRGQRVPIRRDW
ncbi:MAG: DEAD/DEAH box helicase [Chloroflexi bacterium]|nr:DEAD/DEAH box helicase [Chloroflexota bacterium]